MKVYIVESHWGEYEDKYSHIEGVFDSLEKASKYKEEIEKDNCLTESEEQLYYKLQKEILKIESFLLYKDLPLDSDQWDEELAQIFREQTNYELEYYNSLEQTLYTDYKYCDIIEKEVE